MIHLKKTLATCLGLGLMAVSFASHADCQDDERLYRLADFAAQKEAGEEVEPLVMTPQTFLRLSENARQVIGNDLLLLDQECAPMQVLNGQPPARVEMPFPQLWSAYYDAVLRGDEVSMRILAEGFVAAPMDTQSFLSLLDKVSVDEDMTRRLAAPLGMRPWNTASSDRCDEEYLFLQYADFFARMGGRVVPNEGAQSWYVIDPWGNAYAPEIETVSPLNRYGNGCDDVFKPRQIAAANAGALVFGMRRTPGFAVTRQDRQNEWNDRFEEWLEAGGRTEDVPQQSLFD